MRHARLLWLCVCALPAVSAAAAEFAGRRSPPVSAVGPAPGVNASGRDMSVDASGRDTGVKPGHVQTVETTPGSPQKAAVPKGVNAAAAASPRSGSALPQRRVSPIARSNADRLHALQKLQARRHVAMPVSRPVASNRTAAGNTLAAARAPPAVGGNTLAATRASRAVGSAGVPALPVSRTAVRVVAASKPAARALGVGGPRAAGPGLLGGPTFGRNANSAAVDGRVHPKF